MTQGLQRSKGQVINKIYIVELEEGVWLAPGKGDPARTLKKGGARGFFTEGAANAALDKARKYRPFADAKIEPVKNS